MNSNSPMGCREFSTMSAILVLAARHAIPCIVSERGVAGYMVKSHEFGLIVESENSETVFAALTEVSWESPATDV